MQEYHAIEGFMFSLGEGEIGSFLEHKGLKLVEHLNSDEIKRTHLLNENGSLIGQINEQFHFVIASPMDK